MHKLVRTVFSKLHTLDPDEEEAKIAVTSEEDEDLRMSVTTKDEKQPVVAGDATPDRTSTEIPPEKPEGVQEVPLPQTPPASESRPECKSWFYLLSTGY